MIFNSLKRKFFRARRVDEAGKPSHRIWVGNPDGAALIDIGSGKVLAHIWHDGCRKYYPSVYVSPYQAVQLTLSRKAYLVSLRPLPRCTMELIRLRSMEDAQGEVEFLLEGGG